jgi:pyruvyl transferase EpsI
MQALYPDTEVLLTPDIVLSGTKEDYGVTVQERKGVLLCARSDPEKSVDDSTWAEIEKTLEGLGKGHKYTDTQSDCQITRENRMECVRKKLQEFCGAELVITDRLHGMVFAALTETPCIVFSNYNHKVRGTYEWIRHLPYIRYAETAEDALAFIPLLLAIKECRFDNSPLMPYFHQLAEVIKQPCQK